MHLLWIEMIMDHGLQLVRNRRLVLYFFKSVSTKPNDPLNAFVPPSVAIIIFFVPFIACYTSASGILHLMST